MNSHLQPPARCLRAAYRTRNMRRLRLLDKGNLIVDIGIELSPNSQSPMERAQAALDGRIAAVRRFNRFYTLKIGALGHTLLGSDFSLVDVAAASTAGFGFRIGVKSDNYPRVAAWAKRCSERPALKRAR